MACITDLPVELFLLDIFCRLSLPDILALACCSTGFARLCSDDVFWCQKIQEDFQGVHPNLLAMRRCSFKTLYLRIRRPEIYVWGSSLRGCIGPRDAPVVEQHMHKSAVPVPVPLFMPPNARIVRLVAGGSSFAALDDQGRLYFWGTLSIDSTLFVQIWDQWGGAKCADSGASALFPRPVLLQLPVRLVQVSAGLSFIAALDSDRHIWVFSSCLRPFRLVNPSLNGSTASSTPSRVMAGRTFVAVLTESGDIYVIWPFRGTAMFHTLEHNLRYHHERRLDNLGHDDVLICEPWENQLQPLQLPALPSLPCPAGFEQEEFDTLLKMTAIAAGHNFVIGLTNYGHVLKINLELGDQDGSDWARYDDWGLGELRQAFEDGRVRWVYLRDFNERTRLQHDGHCMQQNPKITQISAYAGAFCASSEPTSISGVPQVFLTEDTVAQRYCFEKDALQRRNIASAAVGRSHHAIVTEEGRLLTWGSYTNGALGLGDARDLKPGTTEQANARVKKGRWTMRLDPPPSDIDEPMPVRFDSADGRKHKFVLAAAVGDEHTGAIVVDLEEHMLETRREEHKGWLGYIKQQLTQCIYRRS